MSAPPASRPDPLSAITTIRFPAALGVVLYHSAKSTLDDLEATSVLAPLARLARVPIEAGYLGVSFFFVLSGFILAYVYRPDQRSPDTRRFAVARVARIYPVYFVAFASLLPMELARQVADDGLVTGLAKQLAVAATHLTLLQAWIPPLVTSGNSPAWSLSVEAFLYASFVVLAPRLFRGADRRKLAWIAAGAWAVAIVGATLATTLLVKANGASLAHHGHELAISFGLKAAKFLPILHLSQFLLGAAAGVFFAQSRDEGRRLPRHLALVGSLVAFGSIAVSAHLPYIALHDGLLAPAFALAILGFADLQGKSVFSAAPAVLLGEASYGLYILQVPVTRGLVAILQALPEAVSRPLLTATGGYTLLGLAAYVGLLIAVSVASLRWVEEPARHWIRRRLEAAKPATP